MSSSDVEREYLKKIEEQRAKGVEIVPCPKCEGTGSIKEHGTVATPQMEEVEYGVVKRCPQCVGSGLVPKVDKNNVLGTSTIDE